MPENNSVVKIFRKQLGIFFPRRTPPRPPSCDVQPSWKLGGKKRFPTWLTRLPVTKPIQRKFPWIRDRNVIAQGKGGRRHADSDNRLCRFPQKILRSSAGWNRKFWRRKRFATRAVPSVHPHSGGHSLPYIDGADFLEPFQLKCSNIWNKLCCFSSWVDDILSQSSSGTMTGCPSIPTNCLRTQDCTVRGWFGCGGILKLSTHTE